MPLDLWGQLTKEQRTAWASIPSGIRQSLLDHGTKSPDTKVNLADISASEFFESTMAVNLSDISAQDFLDAFGDNKNDPSSVAVDGNCDTPNTHHSVNLADSKLLPGDVRRVLSKANARGKPSPSPRVPLPKDSTKPKSLSVNGETYILDTTTPKTV